LGGEESTLLTESVRRMGYVRGLQWLQTLCVAAVVVVMLKYAPGGPSVDFLLDRTFRFEHLSPDAMQLEQFAVPFIVWNVGLAMAYAIQVLQLRVHQRNVGVTVARLAALAKREGIELPPAMALRVDTDYTWGGTALVLAALGGFWAIPMAFAGAAQRRYINVTASSTRSRVLGALREIQSLRRPAVPVANYTIHARRCENGVCRATLRDGAQFCARCGTRVAMSNVA
jgi:hypothetical protein